MSAPITVVGAGVSGLTTALALLRAGHPVRILARETSPHTTSDVPGALWYPFKADPVHRVLAWARTTHERLCEVAEDPRSGVRIRSGLELFRWPAEEPWWRAAVPSYRRAERHELPPGFVDGYAFEAPVVETPLYLPWLVARVRDRGGTIERVELTDLAACCPEGGVVVNCSGLGARLLAGDPSVFASRGQLVHLEPLPLDRFTLDEAVPGEITYVIPRRDAVVLGGTVEDGIESLAPDPVATEAILARARRLEPRLEGAAVRKVTVGLRPCRPEVRLDSEALPGGRTAVHNYGHGGAGFTLSWGCAEEAALLAARGA